MIKKIFSALLLATSLVACTDDYTDWSAPQSNPQQDAVSFGNGSVAAVGLIDFANLAEGQTDVQVCNITAPTASDEAYNPVYALTIGDTNIDMDNSGKVKVADLKSYIEGAFGKAPEERTLSAKVSMWEDNNKAAIKLTSGEFQIKAKLDAPEISQHYYLIGQPSEWSPTCVTIPFNHSGANVYDDPIFSVTFPTTSVNDNGEIWFAVVDDKTVASGEWSDVLGAREGNGANLVGEKGFIARRSELTDDGSFLIKPGDAKMVKMTLNMMDGTYLIETLNFGEYVGVIGNHNGWGADEPISSPNFDGQYKGFVYLNGGFKIRQNASWADSDTWGGSGTEGCLAQPGSDIFAEEGYYMVEANLSANTYKLTPITTIGVIGDATAGGWDNDTPLEYNIEKKCWEGDVTFTDGTFKFRANQGWDINWGGDKGNLSMGGDNIPVTAGTYYVELYPYCPGKAYCTLTAK